MQFEARRSKYWKATHALREAEALAGLANKVSGPADAPPATPEEEPSWIGDWAKRGREALKGAYDKWSTGNERLKERAVEIAKRIKEGADRIIEANPLEAAKKGIDDLQSLGNWFLLGKIVATAFLLWLVWKFFLKGRM